MLYYIQFELNSCFAILYIYMFLYQYGLDIIYGNTDKLMDSQNFVNELLSKMPKEYIHKYID